MAAANSDRRTRGDKRMAGSPESDHGPEGGDKKRWESSREAAAGQDQFRPARSACEGCRRLMKHDRDWRSYRFGAVVRGNVAEAGATRPLASSAGRTDVADGPAFLALGDCTVPARKLSIWAASRIRSNSRFISVRSFFSKMSL